jgi:hypothetical protein
LTSGDVVTLHGEYYGYNGVKTFNGNFNIVQF